MNFVWADRLRNIATLMVIMIHVAAPVAESFNPEDTERWWYGNFWNSLTRPGVPLFVMLSGYLLLGKDYPTGSFIKKRFSKVLIPALFWMVAYSCYDHFAKNDPATLKDAFVHLIEGPVHYHLWFIYLIIGLYTFYPILRPWVRQAKDSDFMYLFVLCALGSWGYKILYSFWNISFGVHWEFYTNNLGYFVMGYYLGKKLSSDKNTGTESPIRPWKWTEKQLVYGSLLLIVLGTLATMLGAYWLNLSHAGNYPRYFYDYLTPNVGFASIGWFLLARHLMGRLPLLEVESRFSESSFGIYLAHVFVLDWWAECGFWHSQKHPLTCIPVVWGIATGMVFILVLLIRALPGGDRVT